MRSFTSGGKITKKKLFPQIILSIYSWDLGRQVGGPNPNESLSVAGVMNGFWGLGIMGSVLLITYQGK